LTGVNSPIPGYSRFWSEHALVLSLDEKNQIQALHRTQPGLPMKKGRYGTMTTITSGMARPRGSLRSMCWRAR
jgi:hypothetical protein